MCQQNSFICASTATWHRIRPWVLGTLYERFCQDSVVVSPQTVQGAEFLWICLCASCSHAVKNQMHVNSSEELYCCFSRHMERARENLEKHVLHGDNLNTNLQLQNSVVYIIWCKYNGNLFSALLHLWEFPHKYGMMFYFLSKVLETYCTAFFITIVGLSFFSHPEVSFSDWAFLFEEECWSGTEFSIDYFTMFAVCAPYCVFPCPC